MATNVRTLVLDRRAIAARIAELDDERKALASDADLLGDEKTRLINRRIETLRKALAPDAENGAPRRHRYGDRLTVRQIETLSVPGFYADGKNLYLDFKDPPGKNWVFRFKRGGRARDMGLGPYPDVGLAEARELAEECRKKLRSGIDPLAERQAGRAAAKIERAKALSFRQCAEMCIKAFEVEWTNAKHLAQWHQSLEAYVYPIIGALPVAEIDTPLVMKVLEPIWYTIGPTASRVRGRTEKILGWAATSGYRPKGENPARWKDHLENLLPARSAAASGKHHAALPYAELPSFMGRLSQEDGVVALALWITILTCVRSDEVRLAKWSEFDLVAMVWIVSAERMKTRREHRVPLTDPVVEALRKLQRFPPSDFVFAANRHRPIAPGAMLQTMKRMGYSQTVHGFRSTFSDWCAEQTNFASELREMTLAHAVGNKVEAAYRRGDMFAKRRQLMNAWAKFATGPAPKGEVVPLNRQA
jgi:integrase